MYLGMCWSTAVLSDVFIARICAMSVQRLWHVRRPYQTLHHEDCKIYLFNFCTDPVGKNYSFTVSNTQ